MRPDTAASIENGQRHLDERGRRKVVNIDQAPSVEQSSGSNRRRHRARVRAAERPRFPIRAQCWLPCLERAAMGTRHSVETLRGGPSRLPRTRGPCSAHIRQATDPIRQDRSRCSSARAVRPADRPHYADQLDADPLLLNSPAGIIDLRTGLVLAARSRPRDAHHCRFSNAGRAVRPLDQVPAGRVRRRLGRDHVHAPISRLLLDGTHP